MGIHHAMDNIYEEGGVVYAKERPEVPLVIRRYVDRIYYCKNQSNPRENERVYFERELVAPKESDK